MLTLSYAWAAGTRVRSHLEYTAVSWPWRRVWQGVVVGLVTTVAGRAWKDAGARGPLPGPRRSTLTRSLQTSGQQEPRPHAASSSSLSEFLWLLCTLDTES